MATAAEMVYGALRKIGFKPADSDITGQEMTDAIEVMNDMLMMFENSGIVLGFSRISGPSDTVRVPAGTEMAIKANLAGHLAPEYETEISATLAEEIRTSTTNMLRIVQKPLDVKYPDTLPTGSGNSCGSSYSDDTFFPSNNKINF